MEICGVAGGEWAVDKKFAVTPPIVNSRAPRGLPFTYWSL